MKDNKGNQRNIRVLKKNMIFLQCYDDQISTSTLKQNATFTPVGPVQSVKTKQNFRNITTYVTYSDQTSAALALIAFTHLSSRLRVLFGTVQYCKYFMRKAQCRNDDCVFQHVRDKQNQIIVNDQIDQSVYDDHYDMALTLVEDDDFLPIRKILEDTTIDDNCLIKRGLKRAAESLGIQCPISPHKRSSGKESQLFERSTEQSDITQSRESRDQLFQKSPTSEFNREEERDIDADEYLKIRLIKTLLRENNSKLHKVQPCDSGQTQERGKMMLYQMVKF